MPRRVIIERHACKTKHVLESSYGPVVVEIETITIMTTMVEDEVLGCWQCEDEPPAPSPRRISRRPR
jgi:hypothetical protein